MRKSAEEKQGWVKPESVLFRDMLVHQSVELHTWLTSPVTRIAFNLMAPNHGQVGDTDVSRSVFPHHYSTPVCDGYYCGCVYMCVCVYTHTHIHMHILLHPAFLCLESSSLHFTCLVLSPHANLGLNVTFLEEPPLLLALSCSFRGVQTTA